MKWIEIKSETSNWAIGCGAARYGAHAHGVIDAKTGIPVVVVVEVSFIFLLYIGRSFSETVLGKLIKQNSPSHRIMRTELNKLDGHTRTQHINTHTHTHVWLYTNKRIAQSFRHSCII